MDIMYHADWDISCADILETVLVDLDTDCEAIVIDVWLHNSYHWDNHKKPYMGFSVEAHNGLKERCLLG